VPIDPAQIAQAEQQQWHTAQDAAPQVGLIAGPGTGKARQSSDDAHERGRYSTRVPEPVVHRVVIKTPLAS
jgi:hypothetical protein